MKHVPSGALVYPRNRSLQHNLIESSVEVALTIVQSEHSFLSSIPSSTGKPRFWLTVLYRNSRTVSPAYGSIKCTCYELSHLSFINMIHLYIYIFDSLIYIYICMFLEDQTRRHMCWTDTYC